MWKKKKESSFLQSYRLKNYVLQGTKMVQDDPTNRLKN